MMIMIGYRIQNSLRSTTEVIMRKIKTLLLSSLVILSSGLAIAENPTSNQLASNPTTLIPAAPNINAHGFVLMDANSGKILAEKNMDKTMQPASLTKLMTLYITEQELAAGRIHLNDKIHVSTNAWRQGGSRMFLKEGDDVTVKQLIQGIIVASGNDSCVALAEYIAGNESSFADLMNETAKQLNMKNSHFVDSTGLPQPGHLTTPHDLAILTRAIIKQFPQYYPFFKDQYITYNGIKQPNRNRLLWRDKSVDGLKTGHTKEAGYCLISSANRNNMRLISVVMGTPTDNDRAQFSEALLNWGYRFYKTHQVFTKGEAVTSQRIWLGADKTASFGVNENVYATVPAGSYKDVKVTVNLPKQIKAPIKKGTSYGKVQLSYNGKVIKSAPLYALQDDKEGGFWRRISDHISLTV